MNIGIIGGGYFWRHWGSSHSIKKIETPYGPPADSICHGKIGNNEVFTLQRHGATHHLNPSNIPWRANVAALAQQKLDFVIHVTASGALYNNFQRGDIVFFDQLIDLTKNRVTTLGPPLINQVVHNNSSFPISPILIDKVSLILKSKNIKALTGATVVTIEGPRFSTVAESKMYKMLGADLINMTSCPEIFLFREVNLPVLAVALVTNTYNHNDKSSATMKQISDSINTFKNRIPDALYTLINNIDNLELEKLENEILDTTNLDIRENQKK